ncbi:MAG TPA: fibronectin type III domain-containing protein [Candidatus Limnocylindrales bacterium]
MSAWQDAPFGERQPGLRHRIARSVAAVSISIAAALALPAVASALIIPPGPPVNVMVSAQSASQIDHKVNVVVSWNAAQDNGSPILQYLVQFGGAGTCSANPPTMSCQVIGLSSGTTYTVLVTALNGGGQGPPAAVQYTVPIPPAAPRTVAARVTSISGQLASVLVSWQAPTSDGGNSIDHYEADAWASNKVTSNCQTKALQCTVENLPLGSTQHINIYATNAVGWWGSMASLDFLVAVPPAAPRTLAARISAWDGGFATVEISWAAPSNNGGTAVTGYVATVAPGGKTCNATGAYLSCSIGGLAAGSYTIQVVATNAAGTGLGANLAYNVAATAPPAAASAVASASDVASPSAVASASALGSALAPSSSPAASGGPGGATSGDNNMLPIVLLLVAVGGAVVGAGLVLRFKR